MTKRERIIGFPIGSFGTDLLLISCLAVSLAGNVLLGWRVKSLSLGTPPRQAHDGMSVELKVRTLSGQINSLAFSKNQPTILYVFRPDCQWCAANLDNIRSFSRQRATTVQFIGISTTDEGLKTYLAQFPLPFPVYIVNESSELSKLDLIGTPQTIELSPDGKIQA